MSSNTLHDVIIIGAGFGAIKLIHDLRKLGLSIHGFDKGSTLGGVWQHNRYPGARVDSEVPVYQLFISEVYEDWNFSEAFPGWEELQAYFAHVDKKLNISKDYTYSSTVTTTHWNEEAKHWTVTVTGKGAGVYTSRYLLVCTGFAAKTVIPSFKNRDKFKGLAFHTAEWPHEGIDVKGKKVAVIGTGASGVQVIQEIGREVGSLTVFQRSINTALPMVQRKLSAKEQDALKPEYPKILEAAKLTIAGNTFNATFLNAVDATPEERKAVYDEKWAGGGFRFWGGNFQDTVANPEANALAYEYWRGRVSERVKDPRKLEILAPTKQPYHILTKRPSLEQYYYEILNQDNVDIVDIKQDPIVKFTETGIKTASQEFDFDIVVFATGFDAVTGGFNLIDIRGQGGVKLTDKWADGTYSYLGMTISEMPNLFFLYGPHGPTAFSNGPTSTAIQSEWISRAVSFVEKNNKGYMVPTKEAERTWYNHVNDTCKGTLFYSSKSWYMGANIPGKKIESLNYVAGIPAYTKDIEDAEREGYRGFIFGNAAPVVKI
ncbi:hypothetical protein BABINDRAFT_161246 [Babjeviella inositovora NRRL Y-12698]|uniref:FAD/NAD(P)-binding domain-containing protein n=1 Tax=Babjeviella inositovora NRRL Y-12698 TaxID=984486 RepID=A0A1E3QRH5_9ASCO|nr:uncharacterized protein BABINDRAFT_161246 [Babjeviella inositovora NRRL Y-12698]ODQ80281.1 hypothetical protein BABINDRAFT_161246 [Babjeviella inositovora NRRL Y-12698]